MYIQTDALDLGGAMQRTPKSLFSVSLWYVPGGADYSNAIPVSAFFEDEESASKFEQRFEMPPEMAFKTRL